MGALDDVARSHGLIILEDGSHAPGARYRGRRAGSIGTAAAFSFQAKNLGALGDGGAICTSDSLLAARLRRLRASSRREDGRGLSHRLDGRQAALLRVKLSRMDEWADARRAHAVRYRTLLSPEVRLVEERRQSPSVHHLFPARFENRDSVAATLRAHQVGTAVHYFADRTTSPGAEGCQSWATASSRSRRPGRPRNCRCRCIQTFSPMRSSA